MYHALLFIVNLSGKYQNTLRKSDLQHTIMDNNKLLVMHEVGVGRRLTIKHEKSSLWQTLKLYR